LFLTVVFSFFTFVILMICFNQNFVERYEAIVSDHQQYSKAVMDTQEWLDATHNTVLLWGDMDLERISLHTNLERLKVMRIFISFKIHYR